jgi:hypothetical protein
MVKYSSGLLVETPSTDMLADSKITLVLVNIPVCSLAPIAGGALVANQVGVPRARY